MAEVFTSVLYGDVVMSDKVAQTPQPADLMRGLNVTLFRDPATGNLATLEELGMTLPQWFAAIEERHVTSLFHCA